MRAVNAPPHGCAPSPFPPRVASATNYAMTWNLPNALTVLRLLAAPGVAVMFLYFHRPWADWFALSLFVLAAKPPSGNGRDQQAQQADPNPSPSLRCNHVHRSPAAWED